MATHEASFDGHCNGYAMMQLAGYSEEEEREAREVPCLMRCPSSGGMRRWHDGNEGGQWLDDLEALANTNAQKDSSTVGSICSLMED